MNKNLNPLGDFKAKNFPNCYGHVKIRLAAENDNASSHFGADKSTKT